MSNSPDAPVTGAGLASARTGRRSDATGSLLWTAMKLLAQAAEFVAWVVVARRLPVSDVGVLATAALVARYFGLVGDWGAQHVGAGFVAAGSGDVAVGLARRRAVVSMAAAATFAAGCFLFGLPSLLALTLLVVARGANLDWVGHGAALYRRAAAPGVITGLGMLVAALVGRTVFGLALGFGLAALCGLVVSVWGNGGTLRRLISQTTEKDGATVGALGGAGWILAMSAGDQTMASADIVLLGRLDSTAAAGIYATVYRLPNAMLMVAGLVASALVPIMARRFSNSEGAVVNRSQLAVAGGFGALSVMAVAVPLTLIAPALFGPDYASGRVALSLLFLACAVITFSVPFRVVHLARQPGRRLGILFLAGATVNIVLNLVLIPLAGMEGAAVATLAVQLILTAVLVNEVPLSAESGGETDPAPVAATRPRNDQAEVEAASADGVAAVDGVAT